MRGKKASGSRQARGPARRASAVVAACLLVSASVAGPGLLVTDANGTSLAVPGDRPPTDLDDDGEYEDVDGDGEIDFNDLVVYYQHMHEPVMRSAADGFDYDDSGTLDFNDLIALYQHPRGPQASVSMPANATVGDSVTVVGNDSWGRRLTYRWSFGDGASATGATATHTFDEAGAYEVTLTVTDGEGETDTATRTLTVSADEERPDDADQRVVGYYTSWARYQRGYEPGEVPLEKLTHLHYAFLDVTANGSVVEGDPWGDTQNLRTFRNRSKAHPNTTMMLSVGGWSYSDDFSEAAATPERRERFAETAIALMRTYGFDGIDIDWEYPGGGGKAGNTVRPGDPHNFTLLVEKLRAELDEAEREDGREYHLSVAASGNPDTAAPLDVEAIADDVDYVTVMTYDYHGAWSDRTNHNAPLYAPPDDPAGESALSVNRSMAYWDRQPIAEEKLTMGVPYYGRGYANVPGENGGLYQHFSSTPDGTYGSQGVYEHWDVNRNLNGSGDWVYGWDDQAKAPYIYSPSRDVFVSFPNRRSVTLKVSHARQHGYGGVTIWALSHDRGGRLLNATHRASTGARSRTVSA